MKGPPCLQQSATQKLVRVRAKLGAEESGQPTARNQPSKQQQTRVWGSGRDHFQTCE